MRLLEAAEGVVLEVYIKPGSKRFRVELECNEVVVSCSRTPVKNRVNRELVRELSRLFNRRVELVSGFSSRHKRVLISNIEVDQVNRILVSLSASDVH
jgi:uncharacterized protein (TIGR00251 family)